MTLKTKLYDKLTLSNQRKINKNKELVSLLKTKKNTHFLLVIDMLMIWCIIYPKIPFCYNEYKLLFETKHE